MTESIYLDLFFNLSASAWCNDYIPTFKKKSTLYMDMEFFNLLGTVVKSHLMLYLCH